MPLRWDGDTVFPVITPVPAVFNDGIVTRERGSCVSYRSYWSLRALVDKIPGFIDPPRPILSSKVDLPVQSPGKPSKVILNTCRSAIQSCSKSHMFLSIVTLAAELRRFSFNIRRGMTIGAYTGLPLPGWARNEFSSTSNQLTRQHWKWMCPWMYNSQDQKFQNSH